MNFKNTILIMTSNAGAQRIVDPKNLGFSVQSDEKKDYDKMKSGVMVIARFDAARQNLLCQSIFNHRLYGTFHFSVQSDEKKDYDKMKSGVMEEVKRLFKPEFINRIDEIMVYPNADVIARFDAACQNLLCQSIFNHRLYSTFQ